MSERNLEARAVMCRDMSGRTKILSIRGCKDNWLNGRPYKKLLRNRIMVEEGSRGLGGQVSELELVSSFMLKAGIWRDEGCCRPCHRLHLDGVWISVRKDRSQEA